MSNNNWRKLELISNLVIYAGSPVLLYFLFKHLFTNLQGPQAGDPLKNAEIQRRIQDILDEREEEEIEQDGPTSRNGRSNNSHPKTTKELNLSTYEQTIAAEVVHPSEIPISFRDIGGLDDIILELQESVIYPLTMPHIYSQSSLLSAPSGVLLYGPPGCGKTMLAKAVAHESGAVFINLHISTLTEKWYGDSNKLVAATFSLARKLAPAIVFIDEIDAVLGNRRSGEHEASGMVKAEWMAHMDGLRSTIEGTRTPQRILVLGATNRIQDIDDAILRRMPKRFAIGLPDAEQRRRIFKLVLKDTKVDKGRLDFDLLVNMSKGLSGSDIKEACREAAMCPIREYIKQRRAAGEAIKNIQPQEIRGLRTEDFFLKTKSSGGNSKSLLLEPEDDEYETTDDEAQDASEQLDDQAEIPPTAKETLNA